MATVAMTTSGGSETLEDRRRVTSGRTMGSVAGRTQMQVGQVAKMTRMAKAESTRGIQTMITAKLSSKPKISSSKSSKKPSALSSPKPLVEIHSAIAKERIPFTLSSANGRRYEGVSSPLAMRETVIIGTIGRNTMQNRKDKTKNDHNLHLMTL